MIGFLRILRSAQCHWPLSIFLLVAAASTVRAEIDPQELACGLYYGAAPESDADFCKLRQLGVSHVIDMRHFNARDRAQEQRLAQRYGMHYQHLPVDFKPSFPDANIEAVLRELCCQAHGPIYVHCSLGRDRAGMIVALYRQRYLGWQPEQAYQQKKENEFNGLLVHYDRYFWSSVQCWSRAAQCPTAAEQTSITASDGRVE